MRHEPSRLVVVAFPALKVMARATLATTRIMAFCGALFNRSRRNTQNMTMPSDNSVLLGSLISAESATRGSGALIGSASSSLRCPRLIA